MVRYQLHEEAVAPARVSHPHAGHFFLTGKGVGVLRFTESVVETRVKQRVGRHQVSGIAANLRAIILLRFRLRLFMLSRCLRYIAARQEPALGVRALCVSLNQGIVIQTGHDAPGLGERIACGRPPHVD